MGSACVAILLALASAKLVLGSVCPSHFIQIGSFCYHFSDVEEDWEGARGYCNDIGAFEEKNIILGVLDMGIDIHDNQLLLTNASGKGGFYWMGGHLELGTWHWIDHNNREIDVNANYWHSSHPFYDVSCVMITYDNYRSYLKVADCSIRSKVICQIIPTELGFRAIGQDAFYFSSENDIAQMNTWQGARDFCLSLQPPNNFDSVDLMVLGLNNELDQELLNVIAGYGNDVWLGGQHIALGDSGFTWIDERIIEETFYFWDNEYTITEANAQNYFTYAAIKTVNGHARSTVKFCSPVNISGTLKYDCPNWPSRELNFVCQAYKTSR